MQSRGIKEYTGDHTPLIKIIAIGPVGSGKTSIIRRYVHGHFHQHYKATIGVDFCRKDGKLPRTHTKVDINLWDLAGDDRFGAVSAMYFRKARGIFVVFDITRPSTVESALRWYNKLEEYYEIEEKPPVVFLANKIDLQKTVNYKMLIKLAKSDEALPLSEKKVLGIIETSAKDDIGIHKAMRGLLKAIEARMNPKDLDGQSQNKDVSSLAALQLDDSCC